MLEGPLTLAVDWSVPALIGMLIMLVSYLVLAFSIFRLWWDFNDESKRAAVYGFLCSNSVLASKGVFPAF